MMEALTTDNIKIMGHDYSIERGSTAYIGNPGECNYFFNLIRIANDNPSSTQTEVLLHEILEAIINRCELDVEHKTLTILSESLHQVLRDNHLVFYEEEEK